MLPAGFLACPEAGTHPMWLGQAAPLVSERPAAEVVEALVSDAERRLAELSPRA